MASTPPPPSSTHQQLHTPRRPASALSSSARTAHAASASARPASAASYHRGGSRASSSFPFGGEAGTHRFHTDLQQQNPKLSPRFLERFEQTSRTLIVSQSPRRRFTDGGFMRDHFWQNHIRACYSGGAIPARTSSPTRDEQQQQRLQRPHSGDFESGFTSGHTSRPMSALPPQVPSRPLSAATSRPQSARPQSAAGQHARPASSLGSRKEDKVVATENSCNSKTTDDASSFTLNSTATDTHGASVLSVTSNTNETGNDNKENEQPPGAAAAAADADAHTRAPSPSASERPGVAPAVDGVDEIPLQTHDDDYDDAAVAGQAQHGQSRPQSARTGRHVVIVEGDLRKQREDAGGDAQQTSDADASTAAAAARYAELELQLSGVRREEEEKRKSEALARQGREARRKQREQRERGRLDRHREELYRMEAEDAARLQAAKEAERLRRLAEALHEQNMAAQVAVLDDEARRRQALRSGEDTEFREDVLRAERHERWRIQDAIALREAEARLVTFDRDRVVQGELGARIALVKSERHLRSSLRVQHKDGEQKARVATEERLAAEDALRRMHLHERLSVEAQETTVRARNETDWEKATASEAFAAIAAELHRIAHRHVAERTAIEQAQEAPARLAMVKERQPAEWAALLEHNEAMLVPMRRRQAIAHEMQKLPDKEARARVPIEEHEAIESAVFDALLTPSEMLRRHAALDLDMRAGRNAVGDAEAAAREELASAGDKSKKKALKKLEKRRQELLEQVAKDMRVLVAREESARPAIQVAEFQARTKIDQQHVQQKPAPAALQRQPSRKLEISSDDSDEAPLELAPNRRKSAVFADRMMMGLGSVGVAKRERSSLSAVNSRADLEVTDHDNDDGEELDDPPAAGAAAAAAAAAASSGGDQQRRSPSPMTRSKSVMIITPQQADLTPPSAQDSLAASGIAAAAAAAAADAAPGVQTSQSLVLTDDDEL